MHTRKIQLNFHWPQNPFRIVLVEPEIPPNTGNIGRLCLATGSRLHLVGPLGFRLNDSALRRAGLDYWKEVEVEIHSNWRAFESHVSVNQAWFFSTGGTLRYDQVKYRPGDLLIFGSESKGLPDEMIQANASRIVGIPMQSGPVRSLNLATSVGIVLYEALRQINQNYELSGKVSPDRSISQSRS